MFENIRQREKTLKPVPPISPILHLYLIKTPEYWILFILFVCFFRFLICLSNVVSVYTVMRAAALAPLHGAARQGRAQTDNGVSLL